MLILDLSEIKRVEGMIYGDNEYISLSQGKIKNRKRYSSKD